MPDPRRPPFRSISREASFISFMAACPCGCGKDVEWTTSKSQDLGDEGAEVTVMPCQKSPDFTSQPGWPD